MVGGAHFVLVRFDTAHEERIAFSHVLQEFPEGLCKVISHCSGLPPGAQGSLLGVFHLLHDPQEEITHQLLGWRVVSQVWHTLSGYTEDSLVIGCYRVAPPGQNASCLCSCPGTCQSTYTNREDGHRWSGDPR